MPNRRVLFVTSGCYLDDSSGAAVASRAMMESLARSGFSAEALTGVSLETREENAPATWLHRRGLGFDFNGGGCIVSTSGLVTNEPHHVFSREVYRKMREGDATWIHDVPPGVAFMIIQRHLLGYDPDVIKAGQEEVVRP